MKNLSFTFLLLLLSSIVSTANGADPSLTGPHTHPQRWSAEAPLSDLKLEPRGGSDLSVGHHDGTHVVVWNRDYQVVGVRIDRNGELLDRVPFAISVTGSPNASARVLWTGERFLILWRSGYYAIHGRYLEKDGKLSAPFEVTRAEFDSDLLVATNGATVLVTGVSRTAFLLYPDGSTRRIQLGTVGGSVNSVATDGTNYLVSVRYQNFTSIIAVDGRSGVAEVAAELPPMWAPRLARRDKGYLLFSGGSPLTATPLDQEGRVAGDRVVISTEVPYFADTTSITLQDGTVAAVWGSPSSNGVPGQLMLARISAAGIEGPVALGSPGSEPKLSGDAASPLLVWYDGAALRHGLLDVKAGVLRSNAATSLGGADHDRPAAIGTLTGWFTAWQEGSTIRGATLSTSLGRQREFVISKADSRSTFPSLAANDRIVLVTWTATAPVNRFVLMGRRYQPAGEPIGEAFIIADAESEGAAVVWNGNYFLVAYSLGYPQQLRVARVTEHGFVMDRDGKRVVPSLRTNSGQTKPAIATTGAVNFLVWQDGEPPVQCRVTCGPMPPPARVEGIRLSPDGDPLDPMQTIYSEPVSVKPAVAAREGKFLIVWRESAVVAARLITATNPASGMRRVVADSPGFVAAPMLDVVSRTDGFFVFWNEPLSLRGAALDLAGTPYEQFEISALEAQTPSYRPPGLRLATRGNDLLAIYSKWTHAAGGATRTFVRGLLSPSLRSRGARR